MVASKTVILYVRYHLFAGGGRLLNEIQFGCFTEPDIGAALESLREVLSDEEAA
jgi:hypothetical protein